MGVGLFQKTGSRSLFLPLIGEKCQCCSNAGLNRTKTGLSRTKPDLKGTKGGLYRCKAGMNKTEWG